MAFEQPVFGWKASAPTKRGSRRCGRERHRWSWGSYEHWTHATGDPERRRLAGSSLAFKMSAHLHAACFYTAAFNPHRYVVLTYEVRSANFGGRTPRRHESELQTPLALAALRDPELLALSGANFLRT